MMVPRTNLRCIFVCFVTACAMPHAACYMLRRSSLCQVVDRDADASRHDIVELVTDVCQSLVQVQRRGA